MTPHDEIFMVDGRALHVHRAELCEGRNCSVHNPSDHPLKHAPHVWREDLGLMERRCEHGIGHPDPDDLAFKKRTGHPGVDSLGIHGCDGCCRPERKPIAMEFVKRELSRPPRLLPVVKWLSGWLGTLSRRWAFSFALICLACIFFGYSSGPVFGCLLCGMAYSVSTTFLVRHYKSHHPQYFRRPGS